MRAVLKPRVVPTPNEKMMSPRTSERPEGPIGYGAMDQQQAGEKTFMITIVKQETGMPASLQIWAKKFQTTCGRLVKEHGPSLDCRLG